MLEEINDMNDRMLWQLVSPSNEANIIAYSIVNFRTLPELIAYQTTDAFDCNGGSNISLEGNQNSLNLFLRFLSTMS